ncbi:hypothetical protein GPECTOR_252g629 [Gonium pectorale]|uniref:Uncharacterized protein n=1 Tax=Gonium pectorale TaxID=33097 RepID=A0A150FW88_GONPE|nr:hypothetical protein GPECTOR_252g629 [Gonium pectorale]|eukprot:KXZ41882.1 hypothetical protein GPECTOR_252g629 [Gonium pectorale]
MAVASEMCTAVFEGDLVKLRRLLRSGAPPDACDYDRRSALHIAGAEGNLAAVKLLVDEGGADPDFQDRWGNTALDEARRVGAANVVAFLESRQRVTDKGASAEKKRKQAAHDFLSWCNLGETARLREAGGYAAGEEAGCAFTGLLVAASKGHTEAVRALLETMPASVMLGQAHVAMMEAARCGHPDTVAAFRQAGVVLRFTAAAAGAAERRRLAAELCNAAARGHGCVVASLLAAGASGRAEQGLPGGLGADSDGGRSSLSQLEVSLAGEAVAGEGASGPLHLAAEHSHLEVARRLIEQGGAAPDVALGDGLGRTPLQLAAEAAARQPNDPRVRAVHEYLQWVAGAVGRGLAGTTLAAAAVERLINLMPRSKRWSCVAGEGEDEIERYIGSFSRGVPDGGPATGSGSSMAAPSGPVGAVATAAVPPTSGGGSGGGGSGGAAPRLLGGVVAGSARRSRGSALGLPLGGQGGLPTVASVPSLSSSPPTLAGHHIFEARSSLPLPAGGAAAAPPPSPLSPPPPPQ